MNPTNGSPSSTLRPRTRRLISVEDELDPSPASPRASPAGSRALSPMPSARPSRTNVTAAQASSSFVRSASAHASKAGNDTSKTLSGLWGTSWSAIQGLATNVLGSEAAANDTSTRRRKPLTASHRRASSSAPPKQWGPSTNMSSQVGAGTQEERESMVRAMKRKDLLTANEHLVPDSVGRIKRRNSDERLSLSVPPGENEDRDALIYIHHVRPQDTLAGITIRFNCQQAVLRKANRMWPNDTVQTKKTIVLPVDACGVKGRPVAGPDAIQEDDLLLGDWSTNTDNPATRSPALPNGWSTSKPKEQDTTSVLSSISNSDSESPWKHDSWVLLPNDKEPTEIGRMPRRALGFFPPARRKSFTFSDAASTPRASVDLGRSSTSTSHSHNSPAQSARRARTSSNLSNVSLAGQTHNRQRSTSGFHLHGPGGVGTMNFNVRSPGPAQDGLNKLFAQHLPNVEPPPGQEFFTPWAAGLLDADSGTANQYGGSGAQTPLGGDINFQEIGGAIEGWMRKVGTQASKLLAEPSTSGQGKRSAVPGIGAVGDDIGDLIELRDDAFEIGDGEEDRGRAGAADSRSLTTEQYQSARPDINLMLRARGKGGSGSANKTD
ncbi:hypothetical protein P280DRAFT_521812 [Massarina eburnea CBS 473.64]|uniref:LysM domain-containing protein n=1 Tax=Massarina eburnea CBS 473.64 TaxID=1395130 RepID=A0A6A6RP17_9PLEO|nr:hypothetical protein P280DRAFT_521812 [Massarina eburnea CBS 473.64]